MTPFFNTGFEFTGEYTVWLVGLSMLSFIAGLILVPVFIARIPADYFSRPRRQRPTRSRHPLVHLALAGLKNLFGAVLVMAGLLMLVTPGQGLLTLLIGLMIMNYPGKFALERWLVTRPRILPAINWLRTRSGQVPLLPPGSQE
ncbi:MAG: PGPGW domain-containing protein [Thiogranum sp.]|nr:PGPGW domain-containing protein [Thiogranum sp.]